jgi:hypothetical protein
MTTDTIDGSFVEHKSTDWSSSYSQFLTRSMAHASRTLSLYQEVLTCVAQGQLPATVFQEYYPRFVQAHGTAYTDRLTALGADFLGRLVRLTGHQQASARDVEAPIPIPSFEHQNPTRWFEQYADYAGQLNARAVEAYRRQLDQVAVGELTPEQAQQTAAGQMSQQLPDYLQRVSELYLGMVDSLNEIRAKYEEEYFLGVLALARKAEEDSSVTLNLSAPLGGVAFTSFVITNTTSARTPIHYIATEVRRLDGVGAALKPSIAIRPEALTLGPGEEASISFSLQLEADRYDPDTPYIGFLYLTGESDLRVEMRLRILASSATNAK